MKNLLVSLSFAILFLVAIGCKKSADVDPRDQYVGSYNVTASVSVKVSLNPIGSTVDRYNIIVEKGSAPNELKFTDPSNTYVVELDGNKYIVPVFTTTKTLNGTNYSVRTIGSGVFNENSMTVSFSANNYTNSITTQWDWIGSGVKYK
ncbi:hypothetical protein [Spirosoma endbachense]|uniref:Lipocalin-like domain-containing protein n=1 Tax=Spirosoma endbachense TaxID=2666025 RepID=A0A6P1VVG2_9BACT|nr:hypothetical protein [Spirosoma endbachense]QHV96428.1 hypothetical protein GJR95_15985 [Spirosoma endbachense]